jgi:hypothetical protein
MTQRWRTLLAALLCLAPGMAAAQTLPGFEIGPELYYYAYREPGFIVQHGPFAGVDASYTLKAGTWFLRLNGEAAIGYLDYKSDASGRLDGIWNYKAEPRVLVGDDLPLSDTVSASPYAGIGYRLLYEAQSGRTTDRGFAAYDRLSQYFYVPLGLRFSMRLGDWVLRPSAEYDWFIHGIQKSYISGLAAAPGVVAQRDLTNQQETGYGARAELLVDAPQSWGPISFGPFIRWWVIGGSRPSTVPASGGFVIIATEPHNNTLEAGATLRWHF